MSQAASDLKGGLGWMAGGAVIFAAAWRMDRFEQMGGTLYTAPGLVPGLFGLALILLGAALAWRGRRTHDADATATEPLLNRRVLVTLALTLAYAAGAVGRLPFAPATAVFVAVFAWLYADTSHGPRRIVIALLAGVLTAAVVVLVFEDLFLVRLP
jgi:hypothetical protein